MNIASQKNHCVTYPSFIMQIFWIEWQCRLYLGRIHQRNRIYYRGPCSNCSGGGTHQENTSQLGLTRLTSLEEGQLGLLPQSTQIQHVFLMLCKGQVAIGHYKGTMRCYFKLQGSTGWLQPLQHLHGKTPGRCHDTPCSNMQSLIHLETIFELPEQGCPARAGQVRKFWLELASHVFLWPASGQRVGFTFSLAALATLVRADQTPYGLLMHAWIYIDLLRHPRLNIIAYSLRCQSGHNQGSGEAFSDPKSNG